MFSIFISSLIICLLLPEHHHQLLNAQPPAPGDPKFRIENGLPSKVGQFPYYVGLLERDTMRHYCGGAIIGQRRVLTNAKCVEQYDGIRPCNTIAVLAGTILRHDTRTTHDVIRITVHPLRDRVENVYNFAVLETADDLFDKERKNREPIWLASRQIEYGSRCVLSGWGETEKGELREELLYANLFVTGNKMCGAAKEMSVDFICAEGLDGRNSGAGDIGATLVCNGQLVGLMSWKSPGNSMAKYASVWSIRDWAIDDDPTSAKSRCEMRNRANGMLGVDRLIKWGFMVVVVCRAFYLY